MQILGGKYLDEVDSYLLNHHLVDEERLARAYSEFYGLPLAELVDRPIKPDVARLLPEDVARKHSILVYDLAGTNLQVAIGDPTRLQRNAPDVLIRLRKQKGMHIQLAIASRSEVAAAIRKVYAQPKTEESLPARHPDENQQPDVRQEVRHEPSLPEAEIIEKHQGAAPSVVPSNPDLRKGEETMIPTVAPVETVAHPAKPQVVESPPPVAPAMHKPVVIEAKEVAHPEPAKQPSPAPTPAPTAPVAAPASTLVKSLEDRIKTVDLTKITIPEAVLTKIPKNVAEKYQIIVFAEEASKSKFEPALIKVAAVQPEDIKVREILSFIEQKNKVLVDRYQTDQNSFTKALAMFPEPKAPAAQIVSERDDKKSKTIEINDKPAEPIESKMPEMPRPVEPVAQQPVAIKEQQPVTPSEPQPATAAAKPIPQSMPSPDDVSAIRLTAADIMARPSEESGEELQRLAKEQELNLENQNLDRLLREPITSAETLAKVFKAGRIPEIVAASLFLAIRMKASDIHVEAEQEMVRVRFRVDGILHDVIRAPHFLHAPLISRIKILSKMKIDEQRVPQDGRFDVVIDNRQVDLRVSTLPTVHGEKIVMRLLDKSEGVLTLEQLGVTGTNFDRLIENINKPYGIILSTGPTGSGKSTTLYAVLTRISKPGVNIITLEDPVEYELPGINQAQVKPGIGFTFAEGLRSVLRQDPNVIMVGEVRDLETAAMATHAALTGHLVLSTLHTNDAAGALPRLINMGVEPFLITSSVNAVVGQRLVRKICDNCKKKTEIPPAVLRHVKKDLEALPTGKLKNIDLESLVFYKGDGCTQCTDGYRGRIGIYEVLTMSEKIEALAVAKAPASEIKKVAIDAGMITMSQDGLIKALKGITTIDEVLRVTTTQIKELPV
jgi:type IV pilus assembly protein PilB